MVAAYVLVGSVVGFMAGLWSWMAGFPVLATVFAYVVAGILGILASAVMEGLRHHWTTTAPKERLALPPIRTQLHAPMYDEEAISVVVSQRQQGG